MPLNHFKRRTAVTGGPILLPKNRFLASVLDITSLLAKGSDKRREKGRDSKMNVWLTKPDGGSVEEM